MSVFMMKGVPEYTLSRCCLCLSSPHYERSCPTATLDFMRCNEGVYIRLRSCLERCSDRLNARAQNWHLYLFSLPVPGSAALEALRPLVGDSAGAAVP